ncbi:MAG: MBL fold metallo-hydrolase RNA specificity domain-containing protein [Pirellulales bacterium]
MTRISFHGAAETVTGSKYLLEANGARVMIDCGLFQGLKELRERNWAPLHFDPAQLDAIVLTHAHLDHTGFLPRLVKQGFNNRILCTSATRELAELLLLDAAKNQEEDAEHANRKGYTKHSPALPLFDSRDVEVALRRFQTVERGKWFTVREPIRMRYHESGHLLGANFLEVEVRGGPRPLRLVFSGDVGRYKAPLYFDPSPPPPCDYLICESTYGDRDHPPNERLEQLADVVNTAVRRGGVILVASFSVGRAQQLMYLLQLLIEQNRIPSLPIFLDSPMAIEATKIYCNHAKEQDFSEGIPHHSGCVFDGPNIRLAKTRDESKRINRVAGPAVIIASSGMMTGGRILFHLKRRLPDPRNTIALGGFAAAGTRARQLRDGAKTLRMHGIEVPVKAAVVEINGLSSHADRSELLQWIKPLGPPKRTFVTHGEKPSAEALAGEFRRLGWDVVVPRMDEGFELELP